MANVKTQEAQTEVTKPAAGSAAKGRGRLYNDATVITKLVGLDGKGANPKRPNTAANKLWGCYEAGKTVGAFLKKAQDAGFTKARAVSDLNHAIKVGFIEIKA